MTPVWFNLSFSNLDGIAVSIFVVILVWDESRPPIAVKHFHILWNIEQILLQFCDVIVAKVKIKLIENKLLNYGTIEIAIPATNNLL